MRQAMIEHRSAQWQQPMHAHALYVYLQQPQLSCFQASHQEDWNNVVWQSSVAAHSCVRNLFEWLAENLCTHATGRG